MAFLGGLGDFLFGKAPSAVTQPQQSRYTPEQTALLNNMINYYSNYVTQPAQSYSGQRVASAPSQLSGGLGVDYGNLMSAIMPIASGQISQNPYMMQAYEANVANPMIRNWTEQILPTLRGASNKGGMFYGRSRQDLENRRAGELATALEQGRTGALSNMWQSGLQAQLQALPIGLTIGEASRSLEQQRLDTAYQDWLRTQPGSRPQDQMILALLGQGGMYPSDTVVNPGQSGILQSILQGWATSGFKKPWA